MKKNTFTQLGSIHDCKIFSGGFGFVKFSQPPPLHPQGSQINMPVTALSKNEAPTPPVCS